MPRVHLPAGADAAHVAAWSVLGLVVTVLAGAMALGATVVGGPVLSSQGGWSGPTMPAAPAGQVGDRAAYAVADPAPLTRRLHAPGLLVVAGEDDPSLARWARAVYGVAGAEPIGLASLVVMGRTVNAAAVDPASYRRLTTGRTARMEAVWDAVARGDVAVTHGIASGLRLDLGGEVVPGNHAAGPRVPIGAIATTVPGIDLVVNRPRGRQLGLPTRNAVVVTLERGADADVVRAALKRSLGRGGSVTDLTVEPGSGVYAARLAGGSVADAVGSFGYRWFEDGTVEPDPGWVGANVVTGEVPILGQVTCHRVMLPQLRGALQAVVDAGLAASVDPADFGGCYSPRFIERDPSRGLSLHTWGIAVDLNVTGNQVGTAGTIDPRVVEIFDRWGFAWGGRWRVPDPMHFELAALVR